MQAIPEQPAHTAPWPSTKASKPSSNRISSSLQGQTTLHLSLVVPTAHHRPPSPSPLRDQAKSTAQAMAVGQFHPPIGSTAAPQARIPTSTTALWPWRAATPRQYSLVDCLPQAVSTSPMAATSPLDGHGSSESSATSSSPPRPPPVACDSPGLLAGSAELQRCWL